MLVVANQRFDLSATVCWLVMADPDLPPVPTDSELHRWTSEGVGQVRPDGDVVVFRSPEEEYVLSVERDGPISGYLIELYATADERRLARAVVDDRALALELAVQLAAAVDELRALPESPDRRAVAVSRDTSRSRIETPDEWDDDDDWDDALEDAYEKAEIPRSKGTLTTKTIDGRDYYYLQWREGEKVKSQYVGPVSPA